MADPDRSREFYRKVLGAEVIRECDPVALRMSNSWLILNTGGGPTDDKPDVIAAPPQSAHVLTSGLNIRVADIEAVYREWRSVRVSRDPQATLMAFLESTCRAAADLGGWDRDAPGCAMGKPRRPRSL